MEITLTIPDQVWNEDPSFAQYFKGLQEMVNRMAVSHYKYGRMDDNKLAQVDEMKSGRKRLWMYDGQGEAAEGKKGNTGNTENLLDAANFFIIEYIYPRHPKAKFKAQPAEASPGLTYQE